MGSGYAAPSSTKFSDSERRGPCAAPRSREEAVNKFAGGGLSAASGSVETGVVRGSPRQAQGAPGGGHIPSNGAVSRDRQNVVLSLTNRTIRDPAAARKNNISLTSINEASRAETTVSLLAGIREPPANESATWRETSILTGWAANSRAPPRAGSAQARRGFAQRDFNPADVVQHVPFGRRRQGARFDPEGAWPESRRPGSVDRPRRPRLLDRA